MGPHVLTLNRKSLNKDTPLKIFSGVSLFRDFRDWPESDLFPKPFFKFSGPLTLVGERIAEAPSMPTYWIDMERSRHLVGIQGIEIIDAIGRRHSPVVGRKEYERLRCLGVDLLLIAEELLLFLSGILPK